MTWRLSFILGMLISPSIYFVLFPYAPIQIHDNVTLLMIAGVLVGYGTSMGATLIQQCRVCEEGLRVVKHFCQERNGGG